MWVSLNDHLLLGWNWGCGLPTAYFKGIGRAQHWVYIVCDAGEGSGVCNRNGWKCIRFWESLFQHLSLLHISNNEYLEQKQFCEKEKACNLNCNAVCFYWHYLNLEGFPFKKKEEMSRRQNFSPAPSPKKLQFHCRKTITNGE